ncbi:hypothetical protein TrLO_g3024 [Triparma laevis f. longispina]|uniref:Dynein-1, subspecies f n=1 Tax=Triparma laevis f. longispina TaxID=1714387 RepID=A0A9W7ACH2_9STRA|nr:hypothetical protein TrLO_g3024 [Triparma laevis f. longispina]
MSEYVKSRVTLGLEVDDSAWEYLINEEKPTLPAKERYLGCEFDGYNYVMDTFLSDKAPAGAAAFFFIVNEVTMQEVSEKVLDEEATAKAKADAEAAAAAATPPPTEGDEAPALAFAPVPVEPIYKTITKKTSVASQRIKLSSSFIPAVSASPKVVYFVKTTGDKINPASPTIASDLEFGCVTGDGLSNMSLVLSELFVPLVSTPSSNTQQTATANEFKQNVQKFSSQISHAIQQVKGDVHLNIPDITITDPEAITEEYDIVSKLEAAMEDWSKLVANVVEQESSKRTKGKGPLAEIEFWRQRNAALSSLYEQINMEKVQKMLKVLQLTEAPMLHPFNQHFAELSKLYIEAKDNVKFLTTLERHFKNVSEGSFAAILDTLPSMMNAIKMVWIISRHFNNDERMVPLMERIAMKIAEKVAIEVNIATILRKPPQTTKTIILEAKNVLESWQTVYMDVRNKIEMSGTDHRWEFDRKRLFEVTNYMAGVCGDLYEVTTVLDQFHKFLGPELKSVTGESKGIEDVMQLVELLPDRLENSPYDIFDRRYRETWATAMQTFHNNVEEIEEKTKILIEKSFKKLRSSEGAFELVENFKNIQSRESINQQIHERYNDILEQYTSELEAVEKIFLENKDSPPIYKNFPPTAGAIKWALDLYQRAKKPILRFKAHEGLLNSEYGEVVKNKYLTFARSVDSYKNILYKEWEARVTFVATEKLKEPILDSPVLAAQREKEALLADEQKEGEKKSSEKKADGAAANKNAAAKAAVPVFKMPAPPYTSNFSPELLMIIRESKYLDRMGFPVPEAALNVTLQEDKYHHYIMDLNIMLRNYNLVINSLSPVEKELLKHKLADMQRTLKTGFTPLNWNSQRIPHFIESCNKEVEKFKSVLSEIQKNAVMIEEVVMAIQNSILLQKEDFMDDEGQANPPVDISEFYDQLEAKRVSILEVLGQKYHSIKPLLQKVEMIVADSDKGQAPQLASYYKYWEKRVFNAVTTMVVKSMATFLGLVQSKSSSPICQVKVSLNGKDLVVSPQLNDIYKYLNKCVKNLPESAKTFARWMNGTCLETPPQVISDDEEPFQYSFYQDVSQNPYVVDVTVKLNQAIHKVFTTMNRYLDGWRRYDTEFNLWNPKRKQVMEKLIEKDSSCVFYDSRLAFNEDLAESVKPHDLKSSQKDVNFLRIDCHNVAIEISKQAGEWKKDYGKALHTTSKTLLEDCTTKIDDFRSKISSDPKDLTELKFVLNVIGDISNSSMDMELAYSDVTERYATLKRYNISIPEEEFEAAEKLKDVWHILWVDSKTKDLRLVDVKDQFREVTKEDAVKFQDECNKEKRKFLDAGPGNPNITLDEGLEVMDTYTRTLHDMNNMKLNLVNAENLFNIPVTGYPALNELEVEMEKLSLIYALYSEFKEFREIQSTTLWAELDVEVLQNGIGELEKKCRKFNKVGKETATFKAVEDTVVQFKESIPLIVLLKNDAMKMRHWEKLMEVTGVKFEMNPKTLTLENIFAMELHHFQTAVEECVNEAVQENKIEISLKEIEDHWSKTELELKKYTKDGNDRGYILCAADEIKLELEDHLLNLQTMSGSRFVVIFAEKVKLWEKQLNNVIECLDIWFVVQRKWMYLESIFIGAEDIRLQLPEEAKKFDAIDKAFRTIMKVTNETKNVVKACNAESRLDTLHGLSEKLDKCQKSLTDYLDTKRNAFARFYFISDDELLSVLGSSDPTSIQEHMLKLFDNVKQIGFGRGDKTIVSMTSSEKESFDCVTNVVIEGAVECWMTAVEHEMNASLWYITKEAVFRYGKEERVDWICGDTLGMNTICGSQIWWTWEVEDVFRRVAKGNKYALKELEQKLTGELGDMVVIIRTPLDKITRKKVNTLLVIDVHARDIVSAFVRESILNAKAFEWESQLRFYWDKDEDNCVIQQCTGTFRYGYEYMGLNGRLVITPLTDRCYMTLTQALTFKLGGSPAGPAGTGKTETVKDLAKSLALPCFVINCGEGLDYKAMGSTFCGLVQVGAWGCFDEFNRINIEVLSVVSAQLKAIQNSLIYDSPTVDIGTGSSVNIKRVNGFATSGVFITMNPGYAGRTELPDNLKALFRPVTMIVPDLQKIAENMLFSEGFDDSKSLAKKMVVLYKLSREQLSKQYHYDFGLRSMKTVLVMAGGLKRQFAEMSEDLVLMRILRDANMPKYIFEDVPLFLGLINDLFPGLDCPRVGYEDLNREIALDLEKNGYKCSEQQVFSDLIDKCVQMFETQIVRHTTMIVGPTGGGKSLVLKTLANARIKADGTSVKSWIINPKAQTINELYGVMDPVTRDWTDGVLSRVFRELNQPLPPGKENEMRWIIYDGDVDAVWVENMNSVMDDNRLLTLPNGERIRLQPHCAMICEVFDLQYASPATISRCGMVWVDPKNLGYRPYFERWVRSRCGDSVEVNAEYEVEANQLTDLFDKYVVKCIDYVLKGLVDGEMGEKLNQVVGIGNIDLTKQLCSMLDSFLPAVGGIGEGGFTTSDAENVFLYCLLWGVGGQLISDSRIKFDAFVKKLTNESVPDKLMYDHFYDAEKHRWLSWETQVVKYEEPSPFQFYKIMVPTTQSVLYTHMLEKLAPLKPILYIGESGTAKTLTIENYTSGLNPDKFARLAINMSSRTSSKDVQINVEDNVDKRTGSIYGPAGGKKLIVFIDDMNMPKVDVYGTQQPITLLLTLLNHGFVYDRVPGGPLNQKTIKDLQYIAAMGPPGGGRNPVDPRFISRFNVFNVAEPDVNVLKGIFSNIINTRVTEFNDGIKGVASKLTDVSLDLFNFIVEKLPPTPSKFHYIFNLRDLSRVYEGMCMATPDKFSDSASFVRLWRNECNRVFLDRLATEEDFSLVSSYLQQLISTNFSAEAEEANATPIIFGDFEHALERIAEEQEDPRLYCDLGGFDDIRKTFEDIMENYNSERKPMTLVLFEMALSHLTRVLRIIKNARGNALLIGIGGSGKQSLTKLAAYTSGYSLFEMSLSRGYGETEFREELKELYSQLAEKPVVFLFTDAHVVEEGFLEFINNMLTTGIQPALFATDEKDAMINRVRKAAKEQGVRETPDSLWEFFVNTCRNNLHIVLAMSPSGEKLRVRCRNFPGLISACMIDWFFAWPEDALQKVATYFLKEDANIQEDHMDSIIGHMVLTHQSVTTKAGQFREELRRHYYVTPKNYLDFISNYRELLQSNVKKIDLAIKRLDGGLTKLVDAAEAVDRMSKELSEKKIVVDAKTVDVEALIDVINGKTEIAEVAQKEAGEKKEAAEIQAAEITTEKAKADEALNMALPAVEAAAAALDNIRKEDLQELKAFTNPPELVKKVCLMCVCLKPTGDKLAEDWGGAKLMLGNSKLLDMLKSYPKDKISNKMSSSAKAYLKDKELTVDNMASKSKAGQGLLIWVDAILSYHDIAKNVAPLREKVKTMEKAQAKTEAELSALNAKLGELESELKELNVGLDKASTELGGLKETAAMMEKRLKAASKLIDGLTGERTRWSGDIEELGAGSTRLVGDCLLGASFLSYTGAFTADYRTELMYGSLTNDLGERKVPLTDNFRVEKLLTSDAVVQGWNANGLPADEHSMQNGILTTKGSRFPLCIDPQQQAVTWIKNTYADQQLTVKTLAEPDFMKHLELAIQFGNPFLFENVDEEIDPMLDPVLEKNTTMEAGAKVIKLGDKKITWDDGFKLFFTSKLANPAYTPEVMGKVALINYGVTLDGLANQLLNVVVKHERPDLEEQYSILVTEMSANALMIVQLEDSLLKELSSSSGNILDNEELIATLDETKTKAVEIQGKLEEAQFTKNEINKARDAYKPVSKRGSILYFAASGLSMINSMYEISLDSFLTQFVTALDNAKRDVVLDNRLRNLINKCTESTYDYTCTGIFERHKLTFSFRLTCMILDGDSKLDHVSLNAFLKGDTSLDDVKEKKPDGCEWLSPVGWKDFIYLCGLSDVFVEVLADFKKSNAEFKQWYDLESPEEAPIPGEAFKKLSGMQKLALTRVFRPDRCYNAVKIFVQGIMGEKFVQPPVLDYERIYKTSSALTPMVFILSPGADPQADIQSLGDEMGFQAPTKFKFIALGQGQGPLAMQMLDSGYAKGYWILLQNCHLLVKWLRDLDKKLELMKTPHKDFRLWLTTEPTDKFPLGILQRSLKVVTEPPDGLKLNMRSTLSKIDQALLDECPNPVFRPCLFVLTFLHAVVQERRKYGKIGWNVNYDFNESDFIISRRLVSLYLTKAWEDGDEVLPWGSLKYLIGDAMYGGRVSDDMDRRVLVTYLSEYMGDFLFDDCQKFFFSREGYDYTLPVDEDGKVENYQDYVEKMPLVNSPAVFGLHPNAEIGYYNNATKGMWVDLISLQPRTGGGGSGISREEHIGNVAKGVQEKVPILKLDIGTYDLMIIRQKLLDRNGGGAPTPCQVVLLQELERWNLLTKRMMLTLLDLQKALVGEIGMSDQLDKIGDALFNGFLPTFWAGLAPATEKKLGSWMVHFLGRFDQYEKWIAEGEPACLWLSGLHIPESYLTALVQTTCRRKNWPLDKSVFFTLVTSYEEASEVGEKLEDGCYISGLYLEGAAWNKELKCLRRQDPKVLVEQLPIMQVIPIEGSKLKLQGTFRTPVYVTQQRRNAKGVGLVFEADLASRDHPSLWVLQGVALSLNTDT